MKKQLMKNYKNIMKSSTKKAVPTSINNIPNDVFKYHIMPSACENQSFRDKFNKVKKQLKEKDKKIKQLEQIICLLYGDETIFVFEKFISEKIRVNQSKKISKTQILNEFKEWWHIQKLYTKRPKSYELTYYLDAKLGPYKNRGWEGYEIIYDDYEDFSDDEYSIDANGETKEN